MAKNQRIVGITSCGNCQTRGAMLIIVMWISLGLVSIALFFGDSMLLEYRAADQTVAGLQASQAIEGARRYASFILENLEEPGYMPATETYKSEEIVIGDASGWLMGRNFNDDTLTEQEPSFGIIDECAKLNLNTATLEMLEALPDMTAELAAAIIDWRDTDTELTPNGAESDYYSLHDPSYYCKDGNFETVEELRLVMGGDWELLYGEDGNRNGILDPNENDGDASFPADNSDGRLTRGLLDYVTVYSREPNRRDDGSNRINLTTSREELMQLLQDTFGQQRAEQILQATGPNLSTIQSVLEYYIRSGMTMAEFSQVADALSVTDDAYIDGLLNINTAPAEVLACIPGIGEEFAAKLVETRQNKSAEDLKTVTWVTEVLNNEHAIQAGPYLTARTYQFCVDVAAVGRLGRGFRRELLIIDVSTGEATTLHRRDCTRLGWSLGTQIREAYDALSEEQLQ